MTLIDTHSHIYLDEFQPDRKVIMEHAEKEDVARVFLPAIDSATHGLMMQLETDYPAVCFSMMGLHPCSVRENYESELAIAENWLAKRSFRAVGEIGLDFYWDKTYSSQQYKAFHQQLEWALHYDIPVSIHSRNATDECIEAVTEHQRGKLKGVFHCFSGNEEQAKKITGLGLYLGIGGVVTFKNSGLDKVITEIGLANVVLETDAPYLAPVPFRGKRNEPAYLKYIVEKLAMITGLSIQEVAGVTTGNAEKVFGKMGGD